MWETIEVFHGDEPWWTIGTVMIFDDHAKILQSRMICIVHFYWSMIINLFDTWMQPNYQCPTIRQKSPFLKDVRMAKMFSARDIPQILLLLGYLEYKKFRPRNAVFLRPQQKPQPQPQRRNRNSKTAIYHIFAKFLTSKFASRVITIYSICWLFLFIIVWRMKILPCLRRSCPPGRHSSFKKVQPLFWSIV